MPDEQFTISDGEYKDRWGKLQQKMAENECHLLFVYSDDRAFAGAGAVRYLCDYAVHFEPAIMIMAQKGDPVLVTGPECKDLANLHSRANDVRAVNEFALAGQDYPFIDMTTFPEIAREVLGKGDCGKVGICGTEVMPEPLLRTLTGIFEGCTVENAGGWLTELKMVKSPAEIAIIRHAYELADAGLQACIGAIREGVTEHEIAAEGEYVMRRMGAEGPAIDTIVGSGPNARPIIARSTGRKLEKGDLIVLSIGPRLQGYHAALGRPVFLGETIPEDLDHAMRVSREALEKTREALKPGAIGRDVEAAGRDHVRAEGLIDYYVYNSCHSVGTVEAEEPILGPASDLVLQPNMVFNIDIPLFLAPFGGFRNEDGFLLTEDGNTRLNRTGLGPFVVD